MRKPMGLHIHTGAQNAMAAEYIRAVRPPVMKWLDSADPGLVDLVNSYGGLSILRVYVDTSEQDLGRFDDYLRKIERAAKGSNVRAIEVSHNEAHQSGDELSRKAICDIAGMKLAEKLGKIGIIGCFSVGMPNLTLEDPGIEWRRYRPALEYAAAHGHLLATHEYGGGPLGMEVGLEGFGPTLRGWYCLRYRRVLDWAKSAGVPMPKIVISESGIDDLSPNVMPPTRGWQTARGMHPAGVGDYAKQCERFAVRLAEDDAVVGWCDFGFSSADPEWHAFDLSRDRAMFDRMKWAMAALPDTAAPTPPKEQGMLEQLLTAEFGQGGWDDLRASLPSNPNGPNGDFSVRQLSLIDTIAVHHSAGSVLESWKSIAAYHIGPERGWAGIGYHLGIRQGRVSYLGGIEKGRACVKDLNHRVICVCVAGDYTEIPLSATDKAALTRVVAVLQRWARASLQRQLRVKGHGEMPGQATACPGDAIKAILPSLAAITGDGTPTSPPAPSVPTAALLARGERERAVKLNKGAALQKAILRDGFVPVSGEFTESGYVGQLAEHLGTGAVRVYYASPANWGDVRYAQR